MKMDLHCLAFPKAGNYFTRVFLLMMQEECWNTDLQIGILHFSRKVKCSSIFTDTRPFILIFGSENVKIQKFQSISKVLL